MLSGARPTTISQLLVLRNTRANREVVRTFEATLRLAYPARASDAIRALREVAVPWPGAALLWADVSDGGARILAGPPRGVDVGR